VRIDDREAAADLGDAFQKREHIRYIEVIENPEAQHDIELAIALHGEVTDIVLREAEILEVKNVFGETRFLYTGLTSLDTHHFRPATRELDGIQAFEARQIEDAHSGQWLLCHVGDSLDDAAQLDFVARDCLAYGIHPTAEMDVVSRPGTVSLDDAAPFPFQEICCHCIRQGFRRPILARNARVPHCFRHSKRLTSSAAIPNAMTNERVGDP
jgi:hypothetical protein